MNAKELEQDLPPDESLIMAKTELNYREKMVMQEINYQVRRVTEELNKKRRNLGQLNVHLATLAGMAEGFNLRVVDEIKRKQGAYEAAMIEKMAKTKLPTLDEVNTNPTGSGNGPGHWTEV